jgi:hypothetical protein
MALKECYQTCSGGPWNFNRLKVIGPELTLGSDRTLSLTDWLYRLYQDNPLVRFMPRRIALLLLTGKSSIRLSPMAALETAMWKSALIPGNARPRSSANWF